MIEIGKVFILPAGGFFTFGVIMALANRLADKKGLQKAELRGCEGCPHAAVCGRSECAEETKKPADAVKPAKIEQPAAAEAPKETGSAAPAPAGTDGKEADAQ